MPERHVPSAGERLWGQAFDTARDFIRLRYESDGCVISLSDVLDHLDECFGAAAGLTSDVPTVLGLCAALWEDPHIRQVADGYFEFCWQGASLRPSEVSGTLHTRLAARYQGGDLG